MHLVPLGFGNWHGTSHFLFHTIVRFHYLKSFGQCSDSVSRWAEQLLLTLGLLSNRVRDLAAILLDCSFLWHGRMNTEGFRRMRAGRERTGLERTHLIRVHLSSPKL